MTALVRVSDDIHWNLELNQPTIFVLLDFFRLLMAYAMDCSFSNCVNVMAFILVRRRLFHLIGIKGSVVVTIFLHWPH
jgi:hypothetical protein